MFLFLAVISHYPPPLHSCNLVYMALDDIYVAVARESEVYLFVAEFSKLWPANLYSAMCCTLYSCTVLYCTLFNSTALNCSIALYWTLLYLIALHFTVLYSIALYWTILYSVVLHFIILHFILQYLPVQYLHYTFLLICNHLHYTRV